MKALSKDLMNQVAGGRGDSGTIDVSRTELGALAAGLGGGVGASLAIEAAGGFSAVGAMGAGAVGLLTAAGTGLAAAGAAGGLIGNYAYHNSETVQEYSQAAVGYVVETFRDLSDRMGFDLQREYGDTIGELSCTSERNGR